MNPNINHAQQRIREDLIRSSLALRNGSQRRLAETLESEKINLAETYILEWIPEQAEDIYVVIVPRHEILTVEVPRGDGPVTVKKEGLANYEAKCSKTQRRLLAIALNLQNATK